MRGRRVLGWLLFGASAWAAVPPPAASAAGGDSPQAVWSYPFSGYVIGGAGLEVVPRSGSAPRVYATAATEYPAGPESRYWFALQTGGEGPAPMFASPFYRSGLRGLEVGDLGGDERLEVVLGLADGTVAVYDEPTLSPRYSFSSAAVGLSALTVADCAPEAGEEILVGTPAGLWVYSGAGALLWSLPGAGGTDLVVGQMDADAGAEIATSDGAVVDATTHGVQWFRPGGPAAAMAAADIDLDGRDELLVGPAGDWQPLLAYDVDAGTLKWTLGSFTGFEALAASAPQGGDSPVVFVAEQLRIRAFDPLTLQELWSVPNPLHGVTEMRLADLDGDAQPELLWGAGHRTTGADRLYVLDLTTLQLEWQSRQLNGPALGPAAGDLDGDGRTELVVASKESDSGYGPGGVVVFPGDGGDAITGQAGGSALGIWDLAVEDLDADGLAEILVAAERGYDAAVDVLELSPAGELLLERTLWPEGSLAEAVATGDLDGDGDLELVVVVGQGSGPGVEEGVFVAAYELPAMTEIWRSPRLGSYYFNSARALRVADTNSDPGPEVHVLLEAPGRVSVFDGASGQLEAVFPGPYTAMDVAGAGFFALAGLPSLPVLVGDSSGNLQVFGHRGGAYRRILGYAAGARIDGISALGSEAFEAASQGPVDSTIGRHEPRVWLGLDGRLVALRQKGLQLQEVWRSADYGPLFGRRTVPASRTGVQVVTAGTHGAFGFAIPGSSLRARFRR